MDHGDFQITSYTPDRIMKPTGTITRGCVLLLITLTSVSPVQQKLKSIQDLKRIDFGRTVPGHSLVLLHWFANEIDINNNNVIHLTFDSNTGDYGSHHYGNFEELLQPLPDNRHRYFTVGNLNQQTPIPLPDYVTEYWPDNMERNRDRIIFRVRGDDLIDQVYITQHYALSENMGTEYDPDYTYRVSVNLLRELREFPVGVNSMHFLRRLGDYFESNADDSQLEQIRNSWGQLACLGLLCFIVIKEKHSTNRRNNIPKPVAKKKTQCDFVRQNNRPKPGAKRKTQRDFVVDIPDSRENCAPTYLLQVDTTQMTLKVTTGPSGKARLCWTNVPRPRHKQGVMVVLFKNNRSNDSLTYKSIGNQESGNYDTSVPLNEGLQVRLHEVRKRWCFCQSIGDEITRGAEFGNPMEVKITGYNAYLQLFVKDGKACARLKVNKSFKDWRYTFKESWVGFYSSADKATNDYAFWRWQWATKFTLKTDSQNSYDIYEYDSGMTIAPGVQARFILRSEEEKARTPAWTE
ncbi:uncharacterized protein KZ484_003869 isoform 1-T2 [Pholidichthys leucotaenia]